MRHFKILLWKELRSIIRDPKTLITMFIVPIILVAVIYGSIGYLMRSSIKEAANVAESIAIIDDDGGNWSKRFIDFLRENLSATIYIVDTPQEAYEKYGLKAVIYIPKGFSRNLTENKPGHLRIYIIATGLSFTELNIGGRVTGYVYSFADNISKTIAVEHNIPKDFIESPLKAQSVILIPNRNITMSPEELFSSVFALSLGVPLIALVLISMIVQFAATSMAVEKEEKMLETLLSLPVKRTTIFAVKLVVPLVISLIFGGIYGAVLIYYIIYLSTAPAEAAAGEEIPIRLAIPSEMLPYLGLSLLGGIALGLVLAFVLSIFAEDVRTAQMISGYITTPLVIAIFLPMFIDVTTISSGTRLALALIPFINTALVPKFVILGLKYEALLGSISNPLYSIAMLLIFTKLISTEKIFTARLFRRKARRR